MTRHTDVDTTHLEPLHFVHHMQDMSRRALAAAPAAADAGAVRQHHQTEHA